MFDFDIYCLKNEEWKNIPGYEDLYQASNLGRIRSVDGKITSSKLYKIRVWKGRILKNRTKTPAQNGYRVSLWKDGKDKDWLVHRLVAMAFLGIPKGIEITNTGKRMTVNHKDGNRFNNKIENLEWVTLEDNIRHAFNNDLMHTCKEILLANEKEELFFKSMNEADRFLGRKPGYISNCLKRNKTKITNKNGEIFNIKRG